MAPPNTKSTRPGRTLAILVALIVVMLAGVIGAKAAFEPAHWHKQFKVGLGLDLAGGTSVTLKADTKKGTPSAADMTIASQIMLNRVNALGTSGAEVQQQGNDILTVQVPGKGSQEVIKTVGTTAQLAFRQVLLEAPGYPTSVAAPAPSPSPSPSVPGAIPAPGASPSAPAKAAASPSPSASTQGKASSGGGKSQSVSAQSLAAAGSGAGKTKPKPSPTAKVSPSPSPSPSASPTTAVPSLKTALPTTADAQGNASLVSPPVAKLFDKLNCRDKNWQAQVYPQGSSGWDAQNSQIVGCDSTGVSPLKYVLDVAKVTGPELTSPTAALSSSNQWVINFGLNGKGASSFAALTSSMYAKYYDATTQSPTSPLDQFAIVLDGKVISAPDIIGVISTGQSQITGNFTNASATQLANILKYGSLPLTFTVQQTESVSQQLGSTQLSAGLIAAAIGLLLVVIYSFIYYRGLGVVSISSLVIAAALTYLSVVLLSRYQNLTLSLASIAGLIVAIGITADSFVVFFERLRDEVREGRTLRAAVERGWQRARRTILVSDTVSFLAAALLYFFAIGDVKGFAYTLGLTTLIDVIVVFLFTKPMVTLLARTKFYGNGHKLSGLDPGRLGARAPWRGSRRPAARPATGSAATGRSPERARTTPKEA